MGKYNRLSNVEYSDAIKGLRWYWAALRDPEGENLSPEEALWVILDDIRIAEMGRGSDSGPWPYWWDGTGREYESKFKLIRDYSKFIMERDNL